MSRITQLLILVAAAAFSACKSNKGAPPADQDDVDPVEIVEFTPVADDQRPVVWVSVVDPNGKDATQRIEVVGLGARAGAPGRPTAAQIEFRVLSALNSTGRVRVVNVDTARHYKQMKDEGLLQADSPEAWMLTPQFEVRCSVIDCDQVSYSSKTKSYYNVALGKGESISVLRLAFSVTALRGGMAAGFQSEVAGKQKSTSRSTRWGVGFFGSETDTSLTPTYDEVVKKCAYRLSAALVAKINPQPPVDPGVATPTVQPQGTR